MSPSPDEPIAQSPPGTSELLTNERPQLSTASDTVERGAHFHRSKRCRRERWSVVAALAIPVVAALGVGAAAVTKPLPPPAVQRVLPRSLTVPGAPLHFAWPSSGESALTTGQGVLLGAAGPSAAVPIASISKVMTAYVIVTDHPLAPGQAGPTLTISAAEAANVASRIQQGQSVLRVTAGEQLSEYQALQALLIPSANNIATALARFDAGTTTAFVAKMNTVAAALGMHHTYYADASGYDPASISTPTDQLLLARAALAAPVLAAIVASPSVTLPGVGTTPNYNTLVGHDGFDGIKTGSTPAAGGCLLFAVTRTIAGQAVTIFGAVLGQRTGPYVAAALDAARALSDAAFAVLGPRSVLPAGAPVLTIRQAGRHTTAVTDRLLSTVDPPGTPVTVTITRQPLSVTNHKPVASVSLHTPDATSTTRVTAAKPLPPPSLWWRLTHVI